MNEIQKARTINLPSGKSFTWTNTGLDIPADATLDDLESIGAVLASVESGRQWAAGDWYLALDKHNGQTALETAERFGYTKQGIKDLAWVCKAFPRSSREDRVPFTHHKMLAAYPDIANELLELAATHQPKPPMSCAKLNKEIEKRLGLEGEQEPKRQAGGSKVDRALDSLVDDLPKATGNKVRKQAEKVKELMQEAYSDEVRKEADRIYKEKHADRIEAGEKARKEAKEAKENYERMAVRVDAVLTEEEFRTIRMCLHPDRAPEDRREQFAKAFALFNKMADRIPRGDWAA